MDDCFLRISRSPFLKRRRATYCVISRTHFDNVPRCSVAWNPQLYHSISAVQYQIERVQQGPCCVFVRQRKASAIHLLCGYLPFRFSLSDAARISWYDLQRKLRRGFVGVAASTARNEALRTCTRDTDTSSEAATFVRPFCRGLVITQRA
jgi:hypothetical protein